MKSILITLFLIFNTAFANDLHTIVFIPGMGSSGKYLTNEGIVGKLLRVLGKKVEYWSHYQSYFARRGFPSFVCPLTEDGDTRLISERADECIQQILEQQKTNFCQTNSKRRLHLVGHSMGGLIARLVASNQKVSNCIASVTTFQTPHRGSYLADVGIIYAKEKTTGLGWRYDKLLSYFSTPPKRYPYIYSLVVDKNMATKDLMVSRNAKQIPGIHYASISSKKTLHSNPLFTQSNQLINKLAKRDGHTLGSDGVVPLFSMKYGKDLGRVRADHYEGTCVGPYRYGLGCRFIRMKLLQHLYSITK